MPLYGKWTRCANLNCHDARGGLRGELRELRLSAAEVLG